MRSFVLASRRRRRARRRLRTEVGGSGVAASARSSRDRRRRHAGAVHDTAAGSGANSRSVARSRGRGAADRSARSLPPTHAAAGGRGGRGRGNPPPPPTPPPAVMPAPVTPIVSATAPSPDPRVGLAPGRWDAAQAAWNMRLVSTTPPSEKFLGVTNSDLAFTGKYTIQGNYNGFQVYDISNPAKPAPVMTYVCPASQSDVSVYKNLLFVSGEGLTGRVDCGIQGVPEPVSKDRLRGIRIFDISNIASPKYIANVQTCRGSHTHTVVTDPHDKDNIYVYVSGSARVRSEEELPGCKDGPIDDPNTARFRLEVIRVPLAAPEKAAIVSSPRIFHGLAPPPAASRSGPRRRGRAGAWRRCRRVRGRRTRRRARLQRRAQPRRCAAPLRRRRSGGCGRWRARRRTRRSSVRTESVPRHHRVSRHRAGWRRVRRLRAAARHPRGRASDPHRRGRRLQHGVLAFGDVQQRRHEGPVLRRVGRRHAAALPRHRQAGVGRQRALHASRRTSWCSRATTSCRRRRPRSRTASPTTAR